MECYEKIMILHNIINFTANKVNRYEKYVNRCIFNVSKKKTVKVFSQNESDYKVNNHIRTLKLILSKFIIAMY